MENNLKILFQGDSITDAGRSRTDNDQLGAGYAMMVRAYLGSTYPEINFEFLNRGISGNRTTDLKERWDEDCIDLNPDIVSILIGINDTWRKFDSNMPLSDKEYEDNYRYILDKTNKIDANIVIIEPFLLAINKEQETLWRDDLELKIRKARKLAKEYNAIYIPMDGIFAAASVIKDAKYWTIDGVHPTYEGHGLIAKHWINNVVGKHIKVSND